MTNENMKPSNGLPSFGSYIREARMQRFPGLTIQEFAELLGITGPHLSKIELEKVSPPSLTVMMRLAHELDIPLDFLKAIAVDTNEIAESLTIKIQHIDDPLPTSFELQISERHTHILRYQLSQNDILKYLGELFLQVSRFMEKDEIEEFDKIESVKDLLSTVLSNSSPYLILARKTAFRKMYFTYKKKYINESDKLEIEKHKQAGGIEK